MQLTNLKYTGKKVYRDDYGNVWAPEDTKLVTEEQAGRLLRFPVFERPSADKGKTAKKADDKSVDAKQVEDDEAAAQAKREADEKAATQRENERKRLEDQEHQTKENMLLLIEGMNKGALIEYALKYETTLKKADTVGDLRLQVANLVEQFGAR